MTAVVQLAAELTCRNCGGALETVNPGHADGCRSTWVGSCVVCRRQWAVVATMAAVPSRGNGAHR